MSRFEDHPTVKAVRKLRIGEEQSNLEADTLRAICISAGADDVGFVAIDRPELDSERADVLRLFPATQTIICFVCCMNADSVRSQARNIANHEFHETGDEVNETGRQIVAKLSEHGVRAVNPPMAFPMEMERFPDKIWSISLKPLAVAAGLGQMGIHRNIIHPKFGNFVLIGAVLVNLKVAQQNFPIEYNPCLSCKLCVAACPVGAISPTGEFNFSSCYTHNYREFMGGFTDWAETLVSSRNLLNYREKVKDHESVSMWQSLAFGANYKAAYCMSVCPAGENVISPYLNDPKSFLKEIVKPLQMKEETIYVQPNSDAEDFVRKSYPHKTTKRVGSVLRPTSIKSFIQLMQHAFQPGQSKGLSATYHFRFTGTERAECTVTIHDEKLQVQPGIHGCCNIRITASSRGWLRLLRKEASIGWLLLTFQIRFRGNLYSWLHSANVFHE